MNAFEDGSAPPAPNRRPEPAGVSEARTANRPGLNRRGRGDPRGRPERRPV